MTTQYIIIAIVVAACLFFAVKYFIDEWRENVRYKNYGCAGCVLRQMYENEEETNKEIIR